MGFSVRTHYGGRAVLDSLPPVDAEEGQYGKITVMGATFVAPIMFVKIKRRNFVRY